MCDDPNGFSRSPERPCLHYVVMSSPIPSKLYLPIVSAVARQWPHLLELLSLQRNHIVALRCRRVGAIHSIISGQTVTDKNRNLSAVTPIADKRGCGRIVRFVPKADIHDASNKNWRGRCPSTWAR